MFKINNIFSSGKSKDSQPMNMSPDVQQDTQSASQGQGSNKAVNELKITQNWYEERADKIIVQRNLLMILLVILAAFMVIATLVIAFVVKSKQFEPFVIQLDDATGRASIVDPVSSNLLSADDSLSRYFIKKYLLARENYNSVDFETLARTTVRLFSTSSVYQNFLGYIKNKNNDPTLKYKNDNTTFLTIKSWSKLASDKYIVRFSITENVGSKMVYNKIAVVSYGYVKMELTEAELEINPVGFQVNGYRVDDDNS